MVLFRANLFVIQHLETLYLGRNHVRIVYEKVWRNGKKCAIQQGLAIGSRDWFVAGKSPKLAHVWSMQRSWRVTPAVALQDKSPRLVRQLARNLNSRLSPVARSSRQTILFRKNWPFAFQTHTSINTPYTHVL